MKFIKNVKYKIKNTLALTIALPFVFLIYGSFLAVITLPIVFLIWLVKNIF